MKALYLETSALLTWLLGQRRAGDVRAAVDAADTVATSVLAFVETERALVRAETEGLIRAAGGQRVRGLLQRARAGWLTMAVSDEVLTRAARPFPIEPVRTLDAIHLATALTFIKVLPDLAMLSYDRRILENAESLGIT